jgi:hypothetical protein
MDAAKVKNPGRLTASPHKFANHLISLVFNNYFRECGIGKKRAEKWPEEAQAELAQIALEIDAGLGRGKYAATPAELSGIDRGLEASVPKRAPNGSAIFLLSSR